MTVATKLKAALVDQRDLTVTALAPMLDITRPCLSNVLNGRAALSPDLAIRIEAVFGINAKKMLIAQLEEQIAEARARAR